MVVVEYLWIILQIIVGYNLIMPFVLYLFWLLLKSKRVGTKIVENPEPDYAIIVTAYEQTHLLKAVVKSILNLDYSNYIVYIVADKCDISDLHFEDHRVILLKPDEVLASNTKSHWYAMTNFNRIHDYVTIIDSDNLVHKDYLKELNRLFQLGYKAVQGSRKAKNMDTVYACLDAARDIYYHFYDGKLLFELGSSATLSGSGMAFHCSLYKEFLATHDVKGAGFDKVLQYFIVGRGLRIAFNEDAIVYDEKTSRSDQLVKQRSRWINTWFKYFSLGFALIAKGVKGANFNQFLFGSILLRPPLFIFILLSFLFTFVNFFLNPTFCLVWLGAFMIFIVSFYLSLLLSKADRKIYRAMYGIPRFVALQLKSLILSRKANKYSVATIHFHDKSAKDK